MTPPRSPRNEAAERLRDGIEWEDADAEKMLDRALAEERRHVIADVEDIIMSEPIWPRSGAIRRRTVAAKVRAILDDLSTPEQDR